MSAEVFSESLNFKQTKARAIAARSFRVKIPSSNSTTFKDGATMNIDLPGNLMGQYYNFNQMYLKFKVTNTDDTYGIKLDRCGAAGFIKRIQISTAGSQLFDLNNWNVLYTALQDTDCSVEWKGSSGNILTGTKGNCLRGEAITGLASRTYCVPMVLTPLSNTTPHRLIPAFSLSSIQFKITLENAVTAVKGVDNGKLQFDDVEMVCLMTELSPSAQAQVDAMTGGQYNILASSYMNAGASIPTAGVTVATANLGISVSSLERIIMVARPQLSVSDNTKYSLGNRHRNNLVRFQYQINSENYPARPIECDDKGAEAYAEYLIANHSLVNFREGNSLQQGINVSGGGNPFDGVDPDTESAYPFTSDGDGTTAGSSTDASKIGTFLASCEFESGLSDGKSSTIYSGISTISSVVGWRGEFGTDGATEASQLDFFAHFTLLLSLDMRGSGVWAVSV